MINKPSCCWSTPPAPVVLVLFMKILHLRKVQLVVQWESRLSLPPQLLGLYALTTTPSYFANGFWALTAVCHAYKANILLTDPFPQTCVDRWIKLSIFLPSFSFFNTDIDLTNVYHKSQAYLSNSPGYELSTWPIDSPWEVDVAKKKKWETKI